MKTRLNSSLIVALVLVSAMAQASGDPSAGAAKAKGCASCHGLDGKGRIPLAGKKADYLAEQLKAFKSGARKNEMMSMMASQLSDQDIADLAAYFASK